VFTAQVVATIGTVKINSAEKSARSDVKLDKIVNSITKVTEEDNHKTHSMKRGKNQQDATIRCLLLTSISTCFGHHYAHLQENKDPVTAFGVLFWFCWMWLVAVVGLCVVGCEQCSHPTTQRRRTVNKIHM